MTSAGCRMPLAEQERRLRDLAASARVLEERGDSFLRGQYRHLRERAEAIAVIVEGEPEDAPRDSGLSPRGVPR